MTLVALLPDEATHNGLLTQARVVCADEGTQYTAAVNLTSSAGGTNVTVAVRDVPVDTDVECAVQLR